ncbi:MAG: aminotransferase class III-fold pyridoxal phosphate-dependent enzyme [Bacteriovoracaceae bacterium]|nr:aminotransferase class III-fold pyridoxal phosphate-dependent enzyme [Bacteriovoracaceae bacterium]
MSDIKLIDNQDVEHAKKVLAGFYENQMIPAEKKTYLTDLKSSQGAWLGVEGHDGTPHHFMDAASQIATLGLGFNSSVFHGASHFLESWTNNPNGPEFTRIHTAFRKFMKRKLNWENIHLTYCHSGAEANEIALGECFKRRVHSSAKKVLAFEGSFHGRMLITLASTWNPSKREPFEWKGFETEYCKAPSDTQGQINLEAPSDWAKVWDEATLSEFKVPTNWDKQDELLQEEINCLLDVRKKLLTNSLFAVIIEPMQCEGGDRYLTSRFHSALILMARSFEIPVIHDEVQTGFHLGREFFWHKQLKMKGVNDTPLEPDYVVCAKKAQVGMVISHSKPQGEMEFNVSSAIRGYLHAVSLDQSQGKIIEMEKQATEKLKSLVTTFDEFIESPRSNGLAFSFDFKSKEDVASFIAERFNYGLLFYPAGERTLRFRLNLGFKNNDLSFLFDQLHSISNKVFNKVESPLPTTFKASPHLSQEVYQWSEHMLLTKFHHLKGTDNTSKEWNQLKEIFSEKYDCDLVRIDRSNFDQFGDKIMELQKCVYEPTRQTTLETFKKNAEHQGSVCLGLVRKDELLGMAFSGPLKANPLERGVRQDPSFENEDVLYMIDTTISPELQGRGQGRFLKYALQIIATSEGKERVHGRNRDRLAAGMLFINLSMGAYEQNYLEEDYPDFEKYRDVFYYTSPLQWKKESLDMCSALTSPLGQTGLTDSMIKAELPYLNNKVCLSNFVSHRFLKQVKDIFSLMPKTLRHGFTTSGQSECVDKIAKTLWFNDKKKAGFKMISFRGHHFGTGSFLSRSLSDEKDTFFPVHHYDHPTEKNWKDIIEKLESELKTGEILGVWLEPILQKSFKRVPKEFIHALNSLCDKYESNLILNETISSFHRFDSSTFFASGSNEISPSAVMLYMGGQSGMVFVKEEKFLEKPLMMISTWDGDEFSLSKFHTAAMSAHSNSKKVVDNYHQFEMKLEKDLKKYLIQDIDIKNGCGSFKGKIPNSLSTHFKYKDGRYLVAPNLNDIEMYLEKGIEL